VVELEKTDGKLVEIGLRTEGTETANSSLDCGRD
jgi:hypothetical protein